MSPPAITWQTLALLSACLAAAWFNPPRRSPDEQLRRRLVDQLRADSVAAHLPIEVVTSGGVATVSGKFANPAQHARVLDIVAPTDGVMDIIDELTISDGVITQNVLNALHADPAPARIPVTVTTADGEVTLRSVRRMTRSDASWSGLQRKWTA